MNTLIMSLPIFALFIYGLFNITTDNPEANNHAGTGTACIDHSSWLAKGWILAIIMLTLMLAISGI